MAQELRCKAAPQCTERHRQHYCKICKNGDADHRAANCPYSKETKNNHEHKPRVSSHHSSDSLSMSSLLSKLQRLEQRVNDLESGKNEVPIDCNLGSFSYAASREFVIPKDIPNKCKKILVYMTFDSGGSTPDRYPNITIQVNAHYRVYKHYLQAHTYAQNAWAFNSDNVWLPMPKDRKITMFQSQVYGGNAGGSIRIIRYSL
mmetsp:Transcript_8384/g.13773  ORF Transcript_8384/g.13773 Transcript_8384/m.13773 type:complete len:203 (+) Transcript_8384:60-668(+)